MLRMREVEFSVLQISKMFWGSTPHTRDHCYPPLISSDKLENTCMQKHSPSDKTIVFYEHEVFKVVVMVTR